ncbi:helix-turn-helix domain-containing protein [uncultured Aquabacterium sp.]|uniref:helix-turn-helix domain-containing protein n=1 Tax=Aquabacterium sp. TaxID=1872578 RepID=UPI0025D3967A|nr:helix-turn-helix domain-containing protein [uncultured Aquabacterium sp.]
MRIVFDTETVPPESRQAFWSDVLCSLYSQCVLTPGIPGGIRGQVRHCVVPHMEASMLHSAPMQARNVDGQVARDEHVAYYVAIQLEGQATLQQAERELLLQPGAMTVWTNAKPFVFRSEAPFGTAQFKLPGHRTRRVLPDIDRLLCHQIGGQIAWLRRALLPLVEEVCGLHGDLDRAAEEALMHAAFELIVEGLGVCMAGAAPARRPLAVYHLHRIKSAIDQRLHDPALNVGMLARDLGISATHLHRVFKAESTTAARYILERRLEACAADLGSPQHRARTITEIAVRHGFGSSSHFSRAFRARFGMTPQQWRRAGGMVDTDVGA